MYNNQSIQATKPQAQCFLSMHACIHFFFYPACTSLTKTYTRLGNSLCTISTHNFFLFCIESIQQITSPKRHAKAVTSIIVESKR